MMKKKYFKPEIEIEEEDVSLLLLTASLTMEINGGSDSGDSNDEVNDFDQLL